MGPLRAFSPPARRGRRDGAHGHAGKLRCPTLAWASHPPNEGPRPHARPTSGKRHGEAALVNTLSARSGAYWRTLRRNNTRACGEHCGTLTGDHNPPRYPGTRRPSAETYCCLVSFRMFCGAAQQRTYQGPRGPLAGRPTPSTRATSTSGLLGSGSRPRAQRH